MESNGDRLGGELPSAAAHLAPPRSPQHRDDGCSYTKVAVKDLRPEAEEGPPRASVVVAATPVSDTCCEMGIDVRAYAMANTDVRRAGCVGCGMCAHVCPRGVPKLEVKADRFKGGTPIRVYAVDL